MPAIGKQAFLEAIKSKTRKVPLPELGPDVYAVIRTLDATGLLDMQKRFAGGIDASNTENAARLLVHCLVDDAGQRLFDAADPEAEEAVKAAMAGQGYLLAKLADVALEMSGLPLKSNQEGSSEKN